MAFDTANIWSMPLQSFTRIDKLAPYAVALPVVAVVLFYTYRIIYNAYFHPLRHYPGPWLDGATYIPYMYYLVKGTRCFYHMRLHERYGDVVRISPGELSFRNPQAWKDVYTRRPRHSLLPKEPFQYTPANGKHNIVTAPHEYHSKIRKNIANAFSDKALRGQEDLLRCHFDLLIQRIGERADGKTVIDLKSWYIYTTFDTIGDLTFGSPFGCLQDSKMHPWVEIQTNFTRPLPYLICSTIIPFGRQLLPILMPKEWMSTMDEHTTRTQQAVRNRLAMKTDRPDFMHFIDRDLDDEGNRLNFEDLVSNASAIINAGSETTSTALTFMTFFVLRNPHVLAKLCEEIRGTFQSADDINMSSVNDLPYTKACMNEAMRMNPPVPLGLMRITPEEGEILLDEYVPGNTYVSVAQFASSHSSKSFRDPLEFHPERWLDDPKYANDDLSALHPFSIGPRMCIGQNLAYLEIKVIFALMIFSFDLKLTDDNAAWTEEEKITMHALWNLPALNVTATARKVQ